ncbi:MAG: alpha/beta fold hydrolase [Myxococcota bacterium]
MNELRRDATWPWPTRDHADPDGRMAVTEVGSGRPILFVHGTPTWSIDWRHLVADLSRDHRCIAVDHLGFGASERPDGVGYRPEDHAARFSRFADSLDLSDATVVVHDFGGPIALPWVLANRDRVRRLVLLNTWAWPFRTRSTRFVAWVLGSPLGRVLYRWANLSLRVIAPGAWADRSKLTPELQAQLLAPFANRSSRDVLWALAHSMLASEPFWAHLEQQLPSLRGLAIDLIWGTRDPAFGPPDLASWQQHLPHARTLELPVGHWPHEEDPDAVIARLRAQPTENPPST